ncbi:MAG: hypothetical protein AB9882_02485 [Ignavibacteriaceae bacterium]
MDKWNSEKKLVVDEEGSLREELTKITHCEVLDENGKHLKWLDISKCKTILQANEKEFLFLLKYSNEKGFTKEFTLDFLSKKFKYKPDTLLYLIKKYLPED